jgi:hypothetical protein
LYTDRGGGPASTLNNKTMEKAIGSGLSLHATRSDIKLQIMASWYFKMASSKYATTIARLLLEAEKIHIKEKSKLSPTLFQKIMSKEEQLDEKDFEFIVKVGLNTRLRFVEDLVKREGEREMTENEAREYLRGELFKRRIEVYFRV